MKTPFFPRTAGFVSFASFAAFSLGGCSLLEPAKSMPPAVYSFDVAQARAQAPLTADLGAPVLVLSIPHAAAGYDDNQMIYLRQPHKLEHFRDSQWADTPAAMLAPLIASALEHGGGFGAVVQAPTSAAAQFRLDVELVRLQQEFLVAPSRAHVTLRAHLMDAVTRKIVAWREFDASVPAVSEDPYGGVVATNLAVRIAVDELAAFCAQSVRLQKTAAGDKEKR